MSRELKQVLCQNRGCVNKTARVKIDAPEQLCISTSRSRAAVLLLQAIYCNLALYFEDSAYCSALQCMHGIPSGEAVTTNLLFFRFPIQFDCAKDFVILKICVIFFFVNCESVCMYWWGHRHLLHVPSKFRNLITARSPLL